VSKFEIKESIDKVIYRIYNLAISFLYKLDKDANKIVAGNKIFQEAHRDERCFILGTGPSLSNLTSDQIEKLKNEITFGVNSYYKSEIGKTVVPNYYALVDNIYWENEAHEKTFDEVIKLYLHNKPTFITDFRARDRVESLDAHVKSLYFYAKKYPVDEVSDKLGQCVFGLMNVVSYCIIAAMYMGIKKIYLLGCDYNAFCTFGRGHCYDDQVEAENISYNLAFYLKYYCITTEFHYLIAEFAKKKGVEIVNLTDVSLLDAYKRIPVSDVL